MTRPAYPKGSGQPVPPPNAPRARQLGTGLQPGTPNVIRALQVIISGPGDFLLLYNGTPGAGTLLGSIAPPNTESDPYGNPVVGGGFASYDAANATEGRLIFYGPKSISLRTGNAAESSHAVIEDEIVGSGNAMVLNVTIKGAATTTEADTVEVDLNSNNVGGTGAAAGSLIYTDTSDTDHTYLTWGPGGLAVAAGLITGITPGTGTLGTPATAETWHSQSAGNSWSGTIYHRLTSEGKVHLVGVGLATPSSGVNGTIITLPSGYRPATAAVSWNGTHTGTTNFEEHWTLNTDGTLVAAGFGTSSNVFLNEIVPLDLP